MTFSIVSAPDVSTISATGQLFDGTWGTRALRIDGKIGPIDGTRFESELGKLSDDDWDLMILLNSPGGNPKAAIEIADLVARHEIATLIGPGDRCESSCAFIFMAGRTRSYPEYPEGGLSRHLHVEGKLGFHAPYLPGEAETVALQPAATYRSGLLTVSSLLSGFGSTKQTWPSSLVGVLLSIPADDLLYVTTVDDAGRWGVNIFGIQPAAGLSLDDRVVRNIACENHNIWTIEKNWSLTAMAELSNPVVYSDPRTLEITHEPIESGSKRVEVFEIQINVIPGDVCIVVKLAEATTERWLITSSAIILPFLDRTWPDDGLPVLNIDFETLLALASYMQPITYLHMWPPLTRIEVLGDASAELALWEEGTTESYLTFGLEELGFATANLVVRGAKTVHEDASCIDTSGEPPHHVMNVNGVEGFEPKARSFVLIAESAQQVAITVETPDGEFLCSRTGPLFNAGVEISPENGSYRIWIAPVLEDDRELAVKLSMVSNRPGLNGFLFGLEFEGLRPRLPVLLSPWETELAAAAFGDVSVHSLISAMEKSEPRSWPDILSLIGIAGGSRAEEFIIEFLENRKGTQLNEQELIAAISAVIALGYSGAREGTSEFGLLYLMGAVIEGLLAPDERQEGDFVLDAATIGHAAALGLVFVQNEGGAAAIRILGLISSLLADLTEAPADGSGLLGFFELIPILHEQVALDGQSAVDWQRRRAIWERRVAVSLPLRQ